jgi:poly(A) polymerase
MSATPGVVEGRLADLQFLRQGPLARALAALDGDGEETRLVGGAVRDLARGIPPGDFDLATTAIPDVTIQRARAAGLKVVPTGIDHGTVTVIVDGAPFETTTLREDVETFGRHARVKFGRDFRADALRRDFTLNALSLDSSGKIHDYCGGLADLAAGRVRFIGDARQRIREDYLRILRFFRFSARFADGPLDAEGLSASIAEREGLEILSRERVRVELLKLLVAPRAGEVVEAVAETGLLGSLLAGLADAARLKRVLRIEARRDEAPDPILRLAALGVYIREDGERLRERLRLSNAEGDRLDAIAYASEALHGLIAPPSLGELRALLFERGRQGARDAITFLEIDAGAAADPARFASAYNFVSDTPPPQLPFSGADILARGFAPGQRVGAALKRLQASWIRAGFPKEPEVLARLLDEATREFP